MHDALKLGRGATARRGCSLGCRRSRQHRAALGPFTVDLIQPLLVAMQDGLAIPSGLEQMADVGATAGLAIGQLVVGPLE